ncbi:hypothetical protein JCM30760_23240 [Thiomicrorhabdus hydrogeniphila]
MYRVECLFNSLVIRLIISLVFLLPVSIFTVMPLLIAPFAIIKGNVLLGIVVLIFTVPVVIGVIGMLRRLVTISNKENESFHKNTRVMLLSGVISSLLIIVIHNFGVINFKNDISNIFVYLFAGCLLLLLATPKKTSIPENFDPYACNWWLGKGVLFLLAAGMVLFLVVIVFIALMSNVQM